jgi:hypothetical protein
MAEYYPGPFPDWMRADSSFNLISSDTRRVMYFEANRLVIKAEGHTTIDSFEELVAIAKNLVAQFNIVDLFSANFTSVRIS